MKIIPFDINLRKDIQSEENGYKGRYKVQTRDGKPVKIICWDKIDKRGRPYPIVGLRAIDDTEFIATWTEDGKFTNFESNINDLVLVDTLEPKFKVGDKIKYKCTTSIYTVEAVGNTGYVLSNGGFALFKNEDLFELVPEEPELTDLEKELVNLAKEYAPRLLELAKKEIIEKLKEE